MFSKFSKKIEKNIFIIHIYIDIDIQIYLMCIIIKYPFNSEQLLSVSLILKRTSIIIKA